MGVSANRKPEWFFYPGWVMLSVVSLPIAWALAWALISLIVKAVGDTIQVWGQTHITEDFLLFFALLPALGLLIGLLQYMLLRRYLPRIGWWVAATVLGWSLPFAVLSLAFTLLIVDSGWYTALAIVLIGGSVTFPQWLVLRRRVRRAALWVVAGVLGWGLARLAIGESISSLPDVLAVGLLPPTVASLAWWLLLDKLPQSESNGGKTSPSPVVR